jgi:transposase-like protein
MVRRAEESCLRKVGERQVEGWREFKLEAVRLAAVGDRAKAQIARELGIRVNLAAAIRLQDAE